MAHKHPIGAKTVVVNCQRCKQPFTARVADRARGWGKFCSKSCKAIRQVQTGGASGPGHIGNSKPRKRLPRPDGFTPMVHKTCDTCGAPAVNGVYTNDPRRPIEWGCRLHHDTTPFIDGHGQW